MITLSNKKILIMIQQKLELKIIKIFLLPS